MNRAEELARQAQERAAAYQQAASCRTGQDGSEDGWLVNAKTAGNVPGSGKGATPEQWPDGACGCGFWGSR